MAPKDADFLKETRVLGERLLKLEINIIQKSDMTASPLKTNRHALIDIANKYRSKLKIILSEEDFNKKYQCYKISKKSKLEKSVLDNLKVDKFLKDKISKGEANRIFLEKQESTPKGLESPEKDWPIGSYASFHRLREIANEMIGKSKDEDDIVTLTRIRNMCDNIKQIFLDVSSSHEMNDYSRTELMIGKAGNNILKLSETQLSMIGKIWDIGTEKILMQSVMFVDGDVITRVSPEVMKEENKYILQLHSQAIDMSLNYWRELVRLAKDIMGLLLGK